MSHAKFQHFVCENWKKFGDILFPYPTSFGIILMSLAFEEFRYLIIPTFTTGCQNTNIATLANDDFGLAVLSKLLYMMSFDEY